ncbi:MAG: hypothetical protein EAZ27_03355 [Cytophagales bacterium]|nr:MAG: hypothetical protein EAZ27_03355 [Cytophagales bacterium]
MNKQSKAISTKPIVEKKAQAYTSKPLTTSKPLFEKLTPYLILTALCLIVYGQTFWFEFTGLDDSFFLVVYAQYFAELKNFWRGFKESGVLDYYRPVLFGSMIVDYQFAKTDPGFYHVTNVIYHLGACLVLYRLLIKLGYEKNFALITTGIFTVHPLLSQAVSWVPGRNDSMIALMMVASLNFFLNYVEKRKLIDAILHWFFFAMALYTKETSAFLPFLCIAYVLLFKKISDNISLGMVIGTGYAIIGLVWYAIRAEALELANKNGTRFTSIIYGDSWIGNLPVLPEQIGKMLIPFNQQNFAKFSGVSTGLGIGVIALFILITVLLKKVDKRVVAWCGIWFAMFFIPTIIFIFADSGRYDYLEHRIYVPFLAVVILWNEWIRAYFAGDEARESQKKMFEYGLIGVLIVFLGVNLIYSLNFKNPENFWKKAIEGAPLSSQVYRGMGKVYYDAGELEKAEVNFMKGVDLNPAEVNTISDLGKMYENKGGLAGSRGNADSANINYNSAKRCYTRCLKVDSLGPMSAMFMSDMARIYEKKRQLDSAEIWYQKVILKDPNNWQAKFGLGVLSYQKGNVAACEQYWLDVARINPAYNDTYINLAVLYYFTKNYDQANNWLDKLKAKGVDPASLNPGLVNSLAPYRKKS